MQCQSITIHLVMISGKRKRKNFALSAVWEELGTEKKYADMGGVGGVLHISILKTNITKKLVTCN